MSCCMITVVTKSIWELDWNTRAPISRGNGGGSGALSWLIAKGNIGDRIDTRMRIGIAFDCYMVCKRRASRIMIVCMMADDDEAV